MDGQGHFSHLGFGAEFGAGSEPLLHPQEPAGLDGKGGALIRGTWTPPLTAVHLGAITVLGLSEPQFPWLQHG